MDTRCLLGTLFLLVVVQASPIANAREVDKRRHSTPEILGLEQQLKKAAGENKKYFGDAQGQPPVQVDGLDRENEELVKSAAGPEEVMEEGPGQNQEPEQSDTDPHTQDEMTAVDNDLDTDEMDNPEHSESYMEMWKLFREHPGFMQDIFQDYLNNPTTGVEQNNMEFQLNPKNFNTHLDRQVLGGNGIASDLSFGVPEKQDFGELPQPASPDLELDALMKGYAPPDQDGIMNSVDPME